MDGQPPQSVEDSLRDALRARAVAISRQSVIVALALEALVMVIPSLG